MGKKLLFGILIGWLISIVIAPQTVLGFFRPRTA